MDAGPACHALEMVDGCVLEMMDGCVLEMVDGFVLVIDVLRQFEAALVPHQDEPRLAPVIHACVHLCLVQFGNCT